MTLLRIRGHEENRTILTRSFVNLQWRKKNNNIDIIDCIHWSNELNESTNPKRCWSVLLLQTRQIVLFRHPMQLQPNVITSIFSFFSFDFDRSFDQGNQSLKFLLDVFIVLSFPRLFNFGSSVRRNTSCKWTLNSQEWGRIIVCSGCHWPLLSLWRWFRFRFLFSLIISLGYSRSSSKRIISLFFSRRNTEFEKSMLNNINVLIGTCPMLKNFVLNFFDRCWSNVFRARTVLLELETIFSPNCDRRICFTSNWTHSMIEHRWEQSNSRILSPHSIPQQRVDWSWRVTTIRRNCRISSELRTVQCLVPFSWI